MAPLQQLQSEVHAWELKNFGERDHIEPFLGVVEELGELSESSSTEELRDATADIGIFAIDFCNSKKLSVEDVLQKNEGFVVLNECNIRGICICLGRLAHHILKQKQGIRGSTTWHDEHITKYVAKLFRLLEGFAMNHGFDFYENLEKVWKQVSKRDWTKNVSTGG